MRASQRVSESASQRRTRHFRDLITWQKAMTLAKKVYTLTAVFPDSERYGLISQMRRAAVSVPSNIAEGHGRLTDRSFRLFLAQARGSLFELETQLELAIDLKFCVREVAAALLADCNEVARIINGLLKTLEEENGAAANS
nr:four helix bundle protein [Granulicella mallensis]